MSVTKCYVFNVDNNISTFDSLLFPSFLCHTVYLNLIMKLLGYSIKYCLLHVHVWQKFQNRTKYDNIDFCFRILLHCFNIINLVLQHSKQIIVTNLLWKAEPHIYKLLIRCASGSLTQLLYCIEYTLCGFCLSFKFLWSSQTHLHVCNIGLNRVYVLVNKV